MPIPICAPLHAGRPGCGYPWSWSVCPWFDGDVAADVALDRSDAVRPSRLGEFVAALHQPAPADAPYNEFRRGKPIAEFIPRIEANLRRRSSTPTRFARTRPTRTELPVRDRLAELADVAEWDGPALWLHGDLHSANIIVADGSISAVIDFGDITAGDPAVDLAVAWMLFDEADRAAFATPRRWPLVATPTRPDRSTTPPGSAVNSGRSISPCCTSCTRPTANASSAWERSSSLR